MGDIVNKIIKRFFTYIYLLKVKIFEKGQLKCSYRVSLDKHVRIEIRRHSSIIIEGRMNAKRNGEFRAFNGGKLTISDGCTFNNNCMVACGKEIHIGNNTIFGPNVVIVDHDHDYRSSEGLTSMQYKTGPIVIGDNVWVGANVVILKNTTIGNNVVIGAGCIVSGNIKSNTVLTQERVYTEKSYEARKG